MFVFLFLILAAIVALKSGIFKRTTAPTNKYEYGLAGVLDRMELWRHRPTVALVKNTMIIRDTQTPTIQVGSLNTMSMLIEETYIYLNHFHRTKSEESLQLATLYIYNIRNFLFNFRGGDKIHNRVPFDEDVYSEHVLLLKIPLLFIDFMLYVWHGKHTVHKYNEMLMHEIFAIVNTPSSSAIVHRTLSLEELATTTYVHYMANLFLGNRMNVQDLQRLQMTVDVKRNVYDKMIHTGDGVYANDGGYLTYKLVRYYGLIVDFIRTHWFYTTLVLEMPLTSSSSSSDITPSQSPSSSPSGEHNNFSVCMANIVHPSIRYTNFALISMDGDFGTDQWRGHPLIGETKLPRLVYIDSVRMLIVMNHQYNMHILGASPYPIVSDNMWLDSMYAVAMGRRLLTHNHGPPKLSRSTFRFEPGVLLLNGMPPNPAKCKAEQRPILLEPWSTQDILDARIAVHADYKHLTEKMHIDFVHFNSIQLTIALPHGIITGHIFPTREMDNSNGFLCIDQGVNMSSDTRRNEFVSDNANTKIVYSNIGTSIMIKNLNIDNHNRSEELNQSRGQSSNRAGQSGNLVTQAVLVKCPRASNKKISLILYSSRVASATKTTPAMRRNKFIEASVTFSGDAGPSEKVRHSVKISFSLDDAGDNRRYVCYLDFDVQWGHKVWCKNPTVLLEREEEENDDDDDDDDGGGEEGDEDKGGGGGADNDGDTKDTDAADDDR